MKKLMPILLLFFAINVFAQPGYTLQMKERRFKELTKALKKSPDNYELIWERLQIVFNPQFDLYTKGKVIKDQSNIQGDPEGFFTFSYDRILSDLNTLIENKAEIKNYNRIYNTADFVLLRGKAYYLLGEYQKALKDYHFVLNATNNADTDNKKEAVCIALAAYYYNLQEDDKNYNTKVLESNLRQALKYIDMVSPIEFTENFNDEKKYNYYTTIADPFEYNKIYLLDYLKEDVRLEDYYKKLIRNQYEIFKREKIHADEWNKEEIEKNGYNYTVNESYLNVLRYANDLAQFYYKRKNYQKAEWLTEQTISFYPTNNAGYIVDRYSVGMHYLLLKMIYQAEDTQNFDKEMNSLIELLGGSTQGINYNVSELGSYIKARIKQYPDEPRLHLALGIWNYKSFIGSDNTADLSADEIKKLLSKAENMKLKDYRLYYAKALVYLHLLKDYELALTEINKALDICQFNPFIYSTKYEIVSKFPNPNEQELQLIQKEIKNKWKIEGYKQLDHLFYELEK